MQDVRTKAALIRSATYRKQRARRIEQARITKGLSLQKLANLIGMNRKTLSKVERGESNVKVKDLELIALFTEQNIQWLMFGDVHKIRERALMGDYFE
ncbi:helix-turn-helix domain-containing protein [Vibrio campbellii]|uniref:helix-turn-helix domain-containing protein n=1 Tax=Vibrio campbellii TaxID=680 RepID=UPI002108F66C|nr:helix-turn-helix transcriptional regulator [Vibrio campbellii]UTZ44518.1 helix-turn-helix transcriptional regulator [Vibrio campbellii]